MTRVSTVWFVRWYLIFLLPRVPLQTEHPFGNQGCSVSVGAILIYEVFFIILSCKELYLLFFCCVTFALGLIARLRKAEREADRRAAKQTANNRVVPCEVTGRAQPRVGVGLLFFSHDLHDLWRRGRERRERRHRRWRQHKQG